MQFKSQEAQRLLRNNFIQLTIPFRTRMMEQLRDLAKRNTTLQGRPGLTLPFMHGADYVHIFDGPKPLLKATRTERNQAMALHADCVEEYVQWRRDGWEPQSQHLTVLDQAAASLALGGLSNWQQLRDLLPDNLAGYLLSQEPCRALTRVRDDINNPHVWGERMHGLYQRIIPIVAFHKAQTLL